MSSIGSPSEFSSFARSTVNALRDDGGTWQPDDEDALERSHRQQAFDTIVHQNRRTQSPAAADARTTPRLSIAELNAMDMDAVMDRFHSTPYDDRGPLTRFLDLLDAGRNQILSWVAPGIEARKRAEGEIGAGGQGKVYFSDVLKELGVENRIIRGVGGFLGDVVFDPLTYIGPAGWGAKLTSTTGKTLNTTARQLGHLNAGIKAAARGAAVGVPEVERVLSAYGHTAEALGAARRAGKTPKQIERELRELLVGGVSESPVSRLGRFVGVETHAKGGAIANSLETDLTHLADDATREQVEASRALAGWLNRTKAPGIRIGRGPGGNLGVQLAKSGQEGIEAGSAIAHVPNLPFIFGKLSNTGLYVPGFTSVARYAPAVDLLAKAGAYTGDVSAPSTETTRAMAQMSKEISDIGERYRTAVAMATDPATPEGERAWIRSHAQSIYDDQQLKVQRLRELVREAQKVDDPVAGTEDLLHQVNMYEAAAGEADLAAARSRAAMEDLKAAREFNQTFRQQLESEVNAHVTRLRAAHEQGIRDGVLPPGTLFDEEAARMAETADIRSRRRGMMNAEQQRFIDLTEEDIGRSTGNNDWTPGLMSKAADTIHAELAAKQQIAAAMGGSIRQAASGDLSPMAAAAARALNLDPDSLGPSLWASMEHSFRRAGADNRTLMGLLVGSTADASAATRRLFGNRAGTLGKVRRLMNGGIDKAAAQESARVAQEFAGEVGAIMKQHEIPPSQLDEVMGVLTGLVIRQQQAAGKRWITGEPLTEILRRASESGVGRAIPQLADLALKRGNEILGEMSAAEVAAGALRSPREGYVPGDLTAEAARAASEFKAATAKSGPGGGRNFVDLTEPFQGRKSMTAVQVPAFDADGLPTQPDLLFQFEHDLWGGLTPEDIKDIPDATVRARAEAARELAQRYRQIPIEQRPEWTQIDPFTLNSMSDRFKTLTLGRDVGDVFETNLGLIMANRAASHEKAIARRTIADWLSGFGEVVSQEAVLEGLGAGGNPEFRTATGVKGSLLKNADGSWMVRIGDQRYRKLRDPDALSRVHEMMGLGSALDKGAEKAVIFPEKVAEAIEDVAKVAENPNALVDLYDKTLSLWKSMTLFHPSWSSGNMLGGLILALGPVGATAQGMLKNAIPAMKMIWHRSNPAKLKELAIEGLGDGLAEARALSENRVWGGGVYDNSYLEALQRGILESPAQSGISAAAGKRALSMRENATEALRSFVDAHPGAAGDTKLAKAARAGYYGKRLLWNEGMLRHVVNPWFKANAAMEDWMRTMAYMDLRQRGMDPASAASKVVEGMFDIGDLTGFEKKYMRRVMPFYAWVRSSGGLAAKALFQNPAFIQMAPRAARAVEELTAGDGKVPYHLRPSWMRDQLAIQIGSEPDSRYMFTAGTMLPQEVTNKVGEALLSPAIGAEGLQDFLQMIGFSLAPPIKAVIEGASGREIFSGREISFKPHEGDLSAGEYALSQARPLRELGIGQIRQGAVQKAAEQGAGPLALRLGLGGRAQPLDDERLHQNRLREFKEAESRIRKRITIAERENAKEESLAARARLMALYAKMIEDGFAKGVPAWAKGQLSQPSS